MRKIIVGVMGPGEKATANDLENAYELGCLIAQQGWILLTGGRNAGVMDAANKGAKSANGLTLGILSKNDRDSISNDVDIAIFTDMGNARNNINVLSSDVVIACGMGAGTASEIALALKGNKPIILLNDDAESQVFFKKLSPENVYIVESVVDAIATAKAILNKISDFSKDTDGEW
ncbi:TIGR00725 family protein [Nostoc sp. 106C]|uniref:TIGR00725 family protein n=1 Tax=Nostoc sp. 106C TaxID=1932667 RepID=UPI000A36C4AB|nr:TIGR00725 family protein [Nostoc sp. 106C]OUL26746.1 TIGR00725 family protein [Nostoc sp. 106C]